MAAHGYTGASISRIEKASGLPASSIYWHFGSKDGVLMAMMQRGAERFFGSVPPAEERAGTPLERLETSLATVARSLASEPRFLRLIITLGLQHRDDEQVIALIRDVRRRARGRLEEALAPALEGLPPGDRRAEAAEIARFALAFADGAFIAYSVDEDVDFMAMYEQLSGMLRGMVLSRNGG